MNNRELIQEAIDHSNLPGVEEWKPTTEERMRGMETANCIMPVKAQLPDSGGFALPCRSAPAY